MCEYYVLLNCFLTGDVLLRRHHVVHSLTCGIVSQSTRNHLGVGREYSSYLV